MYPTGSGIWPLSARSLSYIPHQLDLESGLSLRAFPELYTTARVGSVISPTSSSCCDLHSFSAFPRKAFRSVRACVLVRRGGERGERAMCPSLGVGGEIAERMLAAGGGEKGSPGGPEHREKRTLGIKLVVRKGLGEFKNKMSPGLRHTLWPWGERLHPQGTQKSKKPFWRRTPQSLPLYLQNSRPALPTIWNKGTRPCTQVLPGSPGSGEDMALPPNPVTEEQPLEQSREALCALSPGAESHRVLSRFGDSGANGPHEVGPHTSIPYMGCPFGASHISQGTRCHLARLVELLLPSCWHVASHPGSPGPWAVAQPQMSLLFPDLCLQSQGGQIQACSRSLT